MQSPVQSGDGQVIIRDGAAVSIDRTVSRGAERKDRLSHVFDTWELGFSKKCIYIYIVCVCKRASCEESKQHISNIVPKCVHFMPLSAKPLEIRSFDPFNAVVTVQYLNNGLVIYLKKCVK